MGSEASLWAPHTWLEGLPDLNLTPERVVFLAQGELLYPFNTGVVEKGERPFFFLSFENAPSVTPNIHSVHMLFFRNKTNTEIMCHPTHSAFICKHTVQNMDL